ncbi:MAG: hypothetical protein ACM3VT_11575 [Solirubrobacterales bacterium]
MRKALFVIAVLGVACAGSLQAASTTYTGSLAYNKAMTGADGTLFVTGAGDWRYGGIARLTWTVSQSASSGLWHYEYAITVPRASGYLSDVQVVIIEAADGSPCGAFTMNNLFSPASSPSDWLATVKVGSFDQLSDSSLKNLTKPVYGIEFAAANVDPSHLTISFDSDRSPVWGDFYARSYIVDGSFNAMVNDDLRPAGVDTDPLDPAGDGSIDDHILVPGACSPAPVPAPAAFLLGVFGVSLVKPLRHRRWL